MSARQLRDILAVSADPGGTLAVLPVAQKLNVEGRNVVTYVASGRAVEIVSATRSTSISPERAFGRIEAGRIPDLAVVSMCSEAGYGHIFAQLLGGRCPILAVQDIYGGSMGPGGTWHAIRPDYLAVNDKEAKRIAVVAWPDFPPDRVIITGSPAFDTLASFDVAKARSRARESWGVVENWPVVLFAGGGVPTGATLFELVSTLNEMEQPVYLAARAHPRMAESFPGEVPNWELANDNLALGRRIDGSAVSADDAIAGADVVVAYASTMLITAGYLRKAAINMHYPREREQYKIDFPPAMHDGFPPVGLGCCAQAISREELTKLLIGAFSDQLSPALLPAQRRHYILDGHNTDRVVAVCRQLLNA